MFVFVCYSDANVIVVRVSNTGQGHEETAYLYVNVRAYQSTMDKYIKYSMWNFNLESQLQKPLGLHGKTIKLANQIYSHFY